jgi:hypothetical protein
VSRQRIEAAQRPQIPEVLRGTLLDPNQERQIAQDLKDAQRARDEARWRFGRFAFLRSVFILACAATAGAMLLSVAGDRGDLPDLGVASFDLGSGAGPDIILNRSLLYGFSAIAAVVTWILGDRLSRRAAHIGLGHGKGWAGIICVLGAAAATAMVATSGLGLAVATLGLGGLVLAGLTVPGRG